MSSQLNVLICSWLYSLDLTIEVAIELRIIIVEKFTLQHQKQHTMRIKSIPRNAATIAIMNSVFNKSTCKEGCSSISHKVGRRKSQLTVSTPLSTNTYKNIIGQIKKQLSAKNKYAYLMTNGIVYSKISFSYFAMILLGI